MITDPEGTVLALFAAFCRIGGCVMIMPGFSTARVPLQVRLFIAVALSMAILPIMWTDIYPQVAGKGHAYLYLVASETLVGAIIGLVARYYVLGLQFAGTALTMLIGFSPPPSNDVLEDTAENQLTSMISFAGLMLLFMLDFHHVLFEAIAQSYRAMPIGGGFDPQGMLITLANSLEQTFLIMLRLASPFVIYGLLFNVAIGMVNKLAPQIPIYFISQPYLIMGGLFLLYLGIAAMLHLFADGFSLVMQGG
ncbi:flagellar biosynthetic protein FliR [Sinorhizobium alkalisoli]|uniref:Flagellar biosynthetic protein FliR n=1 Tax=Sinorhizobium alkalisoli TaxID=1752398 RepID=A0A1E3V8G9_9HYPH|nr:flagellar biosynthetic protein FliR [Sinorhizobium alkalisoli]MCG5480391.1 flagellar type III secretion system protein FliR [Sinorhizobium alkalisoli]ODR89765.1 flagellar biosynthetic protein FliR [Sinorhizobium alkalisoli]QFI65145.1 Flagellar biosynthesis protein FliR [Sinorhizobium alkalisoli]